MFSGGDYLEINNYKNISDSFSGAIEHMQGISNLTSRLDLSPMHNAQNEIQSIGLIANKMMEQVRTPLFEIQSNFHLNGLLDAFNQLNKIKLPVIDFHATRGVSGMSDSISRLSNIGILQPGACTEMAKVIIKFNQMQTKIDLSVITKYLNTISGIAIPLQHLSEQIQSMNLSQYDLSSLIPNTSYILESIRAKSVDISAVNFTAITDVLSNMTFEEIDIEEDGSVKYQNESYTRDDVQDIVNKALHESNILIQQSSTEINALLTELKKYKQQPLYQQILINLLCGIVLFLATPIMQAAQESITNIIVENKTKIIKLIKIEYQNLKLEENEQGQYRLVKTDEMMVRITNMKNSQSVGLVNFGTVAKVLYKNKSWSLIEYENDNEEIITGWVYTRYLEKLNN